MVTTTSVDRAETIEPLNMTNPIIVDGVSSLSTEQDRPCEKCGHFPHPVAAVRDLPPEMQAQFPILDRHSTPSERPQKTHVTLHGRIISTDEIVQQLKAKETARKTHKSIKKVIHPILTLNLLSACFMYVYQIML